MSTISPTTVKLLEVQLEAANKTIDKLKEEKEDLQSRLDGAIEANKQLLNVNQYLTSEIEYLENQINVENTTPLSSKGRLEDPLLDSHADEDILDLGDSDEEEQEEAAAPGGSWRRDPGTSASPASLGTDLAVTEGEVSSAGGEENVTENILAGGSHAQPVTNALYKKKHPQRRSRKKQRGGGRARKSSDLAKSSTVLGDSHSESHAASAEDDSGKGARLLDAQTKTTAGAMPAARLAPPDGGRAAARDTAGLWGLSASVTDILGRLDSLHSQATAPLTEASSSADDATLTDVSDSFGVG